MGLVSDALAAAKAGYASVSSALGLIETLKNEKERAYISVVFDTCLFNSVALDLVWSTIASNLSLIASTWYENTEILAKLNAFRRVRNSSVFQSSVRFR